METSEKWAIVHDYRRAVAGGFIEPDLCLEDQEEMVPIVGKNDEPAFRCLACRTVRVPGLDDYDRMRRIF